MNRRPNLIVPVLIVICALIVMGGIATGLSQTGDPGASVSLPIALQENETPTPTTEMTPGATGTMMGTLISEPTAPGVTTTEITPAVTTTKPSPIATAAGADRPLSNGDTANTRSASPDGASGVTGRRQEWSIVIATGGRANPIVVGDLVFVQDGTGTTYALDRATGEERWSQSDFAGGNPTPEPTVSPTSTATGEPTRNVTVEPTDGAVNRTLVDVALQEPNLTTLVTALIEAELDVPLNGTGVYTIFAPNNAAFDALPPGALDDLLANKTALTDVLTYRVVPDVYSSEVHDNTTTLVTVPGQSLNVTRSPGGRVMVNDAAVLQADLEVSSGILHVIDTVLVPSSGSARPDEAPTANETTTETTTGAVTTVPIDTETTVTEENIPSGRLHCRDLCTGRAGRGQDPDDGPVDLRNLPHPGRSWSGFFGPSGPVRLALTASGSQSVGPGAPGKGEHFYTMRERMIHRRPGTTGRTMTRT